MTIEDILAQIAPVERSVLICLRGDLAARLDDLKTEFTRAAIAEDDDITSDITDSAARSIAERITAAEAEADAHSVAFRCRAIGSRSWRKLVAEHPPTLDGWRWDDETFAPSAIAASVVLPGEDGPSMSVDEVELLADALSEGQWAKLYSAVLEVNMGEDLIPKSGVGTWLTRSGAQKSTTPPHTESPSPSSPGTD